MRNFITNSIAELEGAAVEVLSIARAGKVDRATVIGLSGDLGAGKTTFVQIIARRLGVAGVVTSPTFGLMQKYETRDPEFKTLIHIDAYRIESVEEMRILGFAALLEEHDTLICIEWPEHIEAVLPHDMIHVHFAHGREHDRTLAVS